MLECVSIYSLVQQYTAQGICGNLVMSQCQNVSSALKCSLSFQNASLTINLEIYIFFFYSLRQLLVLHNLGIFALIKVRIRGQVHISKQHCNFNSSVDAQTPPKQTKDIGHGVLYS